MTRDDFLTAVRELADQLGSELWAAIARQTEAAKAVALQAAVGQLRAQIAGDTPEPAAEQPIRRRAPRRCSKCDELGHDARKCPKAAGGGVPAHGATNGAATPALVTAAAAEPDADDSSGGHEQPAEAVDDQDDPDPEGPDQDDEGEDHEDEADDPREAPSPPPYARRPLRPDRGVRRTPPRGGLTCAGRSSIACCARPIRATTCRRRAGRPRTIAARSTRTSRGLR